MATRTTDAWITDNGILTNVSLYAKPQSVLCRSSVTGVPFPKYKQAIADKVSATTPLTAYRQSCKILAEGGRVNVTMKPGFGPNFTDAMFGIRHDYSDVYYSVPTSMVPSSHPAMQVAIAECRSRAHDKVQSIGSPFNTQVFAAEAREVMQLFRGPHAKLTSLLSAFLSKNAVNRKKFTSKDISSAWLELQFGILPLVSDIRQIARLLNETLEVEKVNRIHSYAKADATLFQQDSRDALFYSAVRINRNLSRIYTAECFITCGITLDHQDKATGIEALSDQLVDLVMIPMTAWELLPFSFLVDYIVNVGDIIQSTATSKSMISYTSESQVGTVVAESYGSFSSYIASQVASVEVVGTPVRHVLAKTRVISRTGGSLGIPPVTVTLPGSNIRYANIAALVHQFFS